MCEVCRGNLRKQLGVKSNLLWLIKGQGQWLRSNAVDLIELGFDFQKVEQHTMPGNESKHIMWRSKSLRCLVVLKTWHGIWDEDIYIEYLEGSGWWTWQHSQNIEKFVNAYVQALCSKTCHTNGDRDTLKDGREGEFTKEFSCSHGDAETRIDPDDMCPYTYDAFAAKFAGKYSKRAIWKYWRDECFHVVSTETTQPIYYIVLSAVKRRPLRRPQDAALWKKLEFKDGCLKRFCSEMSYGIIAALQQSWGSKYFGDASMNLCKVIKNGSVPKYNKRIMELLTENDKAEGVMLRMSRYVVNMANSYTSDRIVERPTWYRRRQVDFLESVLAMYVSAKEDGRETDFRLAPHKLEQISEAFRGASYDAFLKDPPRASTDFQNLCMRTQFPPNSDDDWCNANAWPIGKKVSEPWSAQRCGALQ